MNDERRKKLWAGLLLFFLFVAGMAALVAGVVMASPTRILVGLGLLVCWAIFRWSDVATEPGPSRFEGWEARQSTGAVRGLNPCPECGMVKRATDEFHPHAFCVLYKAGYSDSWRELRNLSSWVGFDVAYWPSDPPMYDDLRPSLHRRAEG